VTAVLLREKTTDEQGNLREMVLWRVEPNPRQPEGTRYRLIAAQFQKPIYQQKKSGDVGQIEEELTKRGRAAGTSSSAGLAMPAAPR